MSNNPHGNAPANAGVAATAHVGGGAAGAAMPPPPQQQAPGAIPMAPPPLLVRSYAEYYADSSKDPYAQQYTGICNEFNVPTVGNALHSAPTLARRMRQAAIQDHPISVAILCRVANSPDEGRIQVFHRMTAFPAMPGAPATAWDNVSFAIAGDVHQGQVTILPFEDAQFDRVPNQH